jgi:hypothetical protein
MKLSLLSLLAQEATRDDSRFLRNCRHAATETILIEFVGATVNLSQRPTQSGIYHIPQQEKSLMVDEDDTEVVAELP